MAFSLFVTPQSGQILGQALEGAGKDIGAAITQQRDFAAEAKSFKNHAKAINEMLGEQSPYKSLDFDSLSNRDLAKMGEQSKNDIAQFIDFQKMKAEAAKNQADAAFKQQQIEAMKSLQEEINKGKEQQSGVIDPNMLTDEGKQALLQHGQNLAEFKKAQYTLDNVYANMPSSTPGYNSRKEEILAKAKEADAAQKTIANYSVEEGKRLRSQAESEKWWSNNAWANPLAPYAEKIINTYREIAPGATALPATQEIPEGVKKAMSTWQQNTADTDVQKIMALNGYNAATPTATTMSPKKTVVQVGPPGARTTITK